MLRKSARVSGRVAVSALLSWTLIPIAVADAPTPSKTPASAAEAADANFKRLHTVPEDGIGDDHWLSGATNLVREILVKRPKEDLVICVAGCIGKQDRVVYAQPSEPTSRQPVGVVSEAKPAPAMTPDADKPEHADAEQKPEFVPTMAQPETADTPSEAPVEAAPEAAEEPATPATDATSEQPQ